MKKKKKAAKGTTAAEEAKKRKRSGTSNVPCKRLKAESSSSMSVDSTASSTSAASSESSEDLASTAVGDPGQNLGVGEGEISAPRAPGSTAVNPMSSLFDEESGDDCGGSRGPTGGTVVPLVAISGAPRPSAVEVSEDKADSQPPPVPFSDRPPACALGFATAEVTSSEAATAQAATSATAEFGADPPPLLMGEILPFCLFRSVSTFNISLYLITIRFL